MSTIAPEEKVAAAREAFWDVVDELAVARDEFRSNTSYKNEQTVNRLEREYRKAHDEWSEAARSNKKDEPGCS